MDTFPSNPDEGLDSDGDCATSPKFAYDTPDYLSNAAGEGCGDASDFLPDNAEVQHQCDEGSRLTLEEQTTVDNS